MLLIIMRNKNHNAEIIYEAISEWENSNLSCSDIVKKYGCNRNAFFYYLRKKRDEEQNNDNIQHHSKQFTRSIENTTNKNYENIDNKNINFMPKYDTETYSNENTDNIIDTPNGRFKQIILTGKAKKDIAKYISETNPSSETKSSSEHKKNKPKKKLNLNKYNNSIIGYEKI